MHIRAKLLEPENKRDSAKIERRAPEEVGTDQDFPPRGKVDGRAAKIVC